MSDEFMDNLAVSSDTQFSRRRLLESVLTHGVNVRGNLTRRGEQGRILKYHSGEPILPVRYRESKTPAVFTTRKTPSIIL